MLEKKSSGDWKERQMGWLGLWRAAVLKVNSRNDTWSVRSFLTWGVPPALTDTHNLGMVGRYVFAQERDDLDRSLFDQS